MKYVPSLRQTPDETVRNESISVWEMVRQQVRAVRDKDRERRAFH
jgi:hypothetical protein